MAETRKETVARALFDAKGYQSLNPSRHMTWDIAKTTPLHWHECVERALTEAAAAIDALADADGIAGVLEKHEPWGWSEQGVSCICDRNTLLDSWSEHAAAAVVAWMKDRP